jgi:hypothetical protein
LFTFFLCCAFCLCAFFSSLTGIAREFPLARYLLRTSYASLRPPVNHRSRKNFLITSLKIEFLYIALSVLSREKSFTTEIFISALDYCMHDEIRSLLKHTCELSRMSVCAQIMVMYNVCNTKATFSSASSSSSDFVIVCLCCYILLLKKLSGCAQK